MMKIGIQENLSTNGPADTSTKFHCRHGFSSLRAVKPVCLSGTRNGSMAAPVILKQNTHLFIGLLDHTDLTLCLQMARPSQAAHLYITEWRKSINYVCLNRHQGLLFQMAYNIFYRTTVVQNFVLCHYNCTYMTIYK